MLEYDAALEEQFTALQTAAYKKSLAVGHTVVRNFAASATTVHSDNSTLVEELRVDCKEQTAQMKRLTALVNSLASKSNAPPRRGHQRSAP